MSKTKCQTGRGKNLKTRTIIKFLFYKSFFTDVVTNATRICIFEGRNLLQWPHALRYLEPFSTGLCVLTAVPQPLQPSRGDSEPGHRESQAGKGSSLGLLPCHNEFFFWGTAGRILQHLPMTLNIGRGFLAHIQILSVCPSLIITDLL